MKIETIKNQTSFNAKINQKFINDAERYYLGRKLVFQYDSFKKKLEKFEMYGEENTEILHHSLQNKDGSVTHMLCLKNELINKKQAVIMYTANKYNEILRFFNNINENKILECEENLAK